MYDLVVIGGGSGGVRASRIAASHGAKVAMIDLSLEHGPPNYSAIGGTCVNVGCVPKKLMVYASKYREEFSDAEGYGWSAVSPKPKFDWDAFMVKKNKEISRLNGIYGRMLGNAGVEIIEGKGSFLSKNEVLVQKSDGSESTISGENIVVAVGGWPFKPDIPGIEHAITSNEVFYLEKQPERVIIVGGGYIAVEFACILHGMGSEVTLMYRGDKFLRGFDEDCRDHLASELGKTSLDLKFKTNPSKIEKNPDGTFSVQTEAGDMFECDAVMYATGRDCVATTKTLGLDKAGVKSGKGGFIPVDEYSKTNVDNIYAIGDITDRMALTPVALHEGHCLADTLYGGKDRKPDHKYIASAVFSQPEIGNVGYTEDDAVKEFKNVTVYKSTFKPMAYSFTGREVKMLMKLVVDDNTDRVVGVHICGSGAGEMIQGVGIAVKMGATKAEFDQTIGVHPTSLEELVTMRTPSHSYKNGARVAKM